MSRTPFTFTDLLQDCKIETECYSLDNRKLGAKIFVPEELFQRYPYNASAYVFLQQLRQEIFEFGTIEFPNLPINKTNYTLAQRSPQEHAYSPNPYMTDSCQLPHQDTPPYPTAFWLEEKRRYFSTWVLSMTGVEEFFAFTNEHPELTLIETHKKSVPTSLKNNTGLLLNQSTGLLLIDNSNHQSLYHARTCNFKAIQDNPDYSSDTPMHAFNEIGLLNYIDTLDIRRGNEHRDAQDLRQIKAFMTWEGSIN